MNSTPPLRYVLQSLLQGMSLTRSYLNWETRKHVITGNVIDLGSGTKNKYHEMIEVGHVSVKKVDQKIQRRSIDFEKDTLPFKEESFDHVLLYNVLEHIFNYQHLVAEIHRILSPKGGTLTGFVPFMMWYHPDPHDYFRYTHEALERIFREAGFRKITITPLSGAMFTLQFQTMSQSLPRILSVMLYPLYHALDKAVLHFKMIPPERYALGYFFIVHK